MKTKVYRQGGGANSGPEAPNVCAVRQMCRGNIHCSAQINYSVGIVIILAKIKLLRASKKNLYPCSEKNLLIVKQCY